MKYFTSARRNFSTNLLSKVARSVPRSGIREIMDAAWALEA